MAGKNGLSKTEPLKLAKNVSNGFSEMTSALKPTQTASLETKLQIKTLLSER